MRNTEDSNTLGFIVKTNKHQIKQTVKQLYDSNTAKVNTPSDLREKRRLWALGPDYNALGAAKKIGNI